MFYLLKSSYEREQVGDVLIDLDKVESIAILSKKFKDTENMIYKIIVTMQSKDAWNGVYKTLDEAKKVIKEIIGDKVSDADLADLIS